MRRRANDLETLLAFTGWGIARYIAAATRALRQIPTAPSFAVFGESLVPAVTTFHDYAHTASDEAFQLPAALRALCERGI